MTVLLPKSANRFRVSFDDFGKGNKDHMTAQVLRVTRPHMLGYDIYGAAGVQPIEIDLRDDAMDITRTEVITQFVRQIKDDVTFGMTIETFDQHEKVLERWNLVQCRISDFYLDDLNTANSSGLMIRLKIAVKRISASLGDQTVVMLG